MNFHQRYAKDSNRAGTESDYGRQLSIGRVPPPDQVLYQTERYHTNTFGYDIPVREDGWYLLVLKFSEVYFGAPNMKVCKIYFSFSCVMKRCQRNSLLVLSVCTLTTKL